MCWGGQGGLSVTTHTPPLGPADMQLLGLGLEEKEEGTSSNRLRLPSCESQLWRTGLKACRLAVAGRGPGGP